MSFSPSFLAELRDRLPLSSVIGKKLRLTRAGREYKACCPFHNEKTPSFYINDEKQFYHCFGCGAHGDVIGFTMHHDHMSFPEAIEALAAQAGLQVPRDTPMDREKFDQEKRLFELMERATKWYEEQLFAPVGREALNYLKGRNLGEEAIRRFRLGYAPNDGQSLIKKLTAEGYKIDEMAMVGLAKKADPLRQRNPTQAPSHDTGASAARDRNEFYAFFRNRVMFPVGDRRGRTVAFGGRVLGDGEPKYLNSPDHALFHKGKLLYGLSRARTASAQGQPLIVVEGYMDVIALVEAGYSGAVAPLGTALTEDQIALLWKLMPPIDARDPSHDYSPILCFDGDNAGLRAAARATERALPLLAPSQTLRIATLTGAKDPDDLIRQSGKSAMEAVLKQAKPMIDVIWEMTLAGRQLRTPEERAAFTTAIKQKAARIGNEQLRQLYMDEIQKRLSGLFSWRQEKSPESGYGGGSYGKGGYGGKGSWRPPLPPMPLINRKQPQNARRLFERGILAVIINHPDLFEDFGEDLAHLAFGSPDYEALRQRLIEILSLESHEPLDAAELYRHLSQAGEAGSGTDSRRTSLEEVLSEATYVHFGFARPGRSIEQARQGWKSIWNRHLQDQLQADLQSAKRRYDEEASDENYTRLMTLRGQVEALMVESGEAVADNATLLSQES